jgi:hypothetical protein
LRYSIAEPSVDPLVTRPVSFTVKREFAGSQSTEVLDRFTEPVGLANHRLIETGAEVEAAKDNVPGALVVQSIGDEK